MRLRFLKGMVGTGVRVKPGDLADWPNEPEALRLIEHGIAEAVEEEPAAPAPKPAKASKGKK